MGLLDQFLDLFLKLTDPTPSFAPERCLLERGAVGGCSACADACPKGAIDLSTDAVLLDEAACTGCGLCVGVCPGIALEYPLGPLQEAFQKGQGKLKCSRAPGDGEEVVCLGRLTPGILAWAASRFGGLTLARGDCASCAIGGPRVPEHVERMAEEARRYYPALELKLTTEPLPSPKIGRRELFQSLFGATRRLAAEALPELPEEIAPADDEETLPAELRLRKLAAQKAPEVRWPGVRVLEGCTLCPVCQNACPTAAIRRFRDGEERVLELVLERCTGCEACVRSCPVQVMEPLDYGKDALFSEGIELFRGVPDEGA